jgi:hypothetical protein
MGGRMRRELSLANCWLLMVVGGGLGVERDVLLLLVMRGPGMWQSMTVVGG